MALGIVAVVHILQTLPICMYVYTYNKFCATYKDIQVTTVRSLILLVLYSHLQIQCSTFHRENLTLQTSTYSLLGTSFSLSSSFVMMPFIFSYSPPDSLWHPSSKQAGVRELPLAHSQPKLQKPPMRAFIPRTYLAAPLHYTPPISSFLSVSLCLTHTHLYAPSTDTRNTSGGHHHFLRYLPLICRSNFVHVESVEHVWSHCPYSLVSIAPFWASKERRWGDKVCTYISAIIPQQTGLLVSRIVPPTLVHIASLGSSKGWKLEPRWRCQFGVNGG